MEKENKKVILEALSAEEWEMNKEIILAILNGDLPEGISYTEMDFDEAYLQGSQKTISIPKECVDLLKEKYENHIKEKK